MSKDKKIGLDETKLLVTKANGTQELFSEKKLRHSIQRARLPKIVEEKIIKDLKPNLYSGITTTEILKRIQQIIKQTEYPYIGARYNLKKSIMELGPSGYPFEKFIAAILKQYGYITQTNLILKGHCVEHEIDVVAEKDGKRAFLECKFHNQPGSRSDIKVVLYTHSRFHDLVEGYKQGQSELKIDEAWIVTNTKATTEAIKYASCTGMKILGWNYPRTGNLQDMIEEKKLHPVTCLASLSVQQKKLLLSQGIVLCTDFIKASNKTLYEIGITKDQKNQVKEEIAAICVNDHHNNN